MELYRNILIDEFENRKARAHSYSLRGYAKSLDLSPATVSGILNHKRSLPKKKVEIVAEKLGLDPVRKAAFIKSAKLSKTSLRTLSAESVSSIAPKILDDQKDYNIIAKWEYYAVLNLTQTEGFQNDATWIGKRLGISTSRAEKVLSELMDRKLLIEEEGELKRLETNLETTRDVFSQALRDSHKENFKLAAEKLEEVSIEKRFYSATTMAIDVDRMDEAKELIREFREKLSTLMSKDQTNEVYQFNLQLFPLTNVDVRSEN